MKKRAIVGVFFLVAFGASTVTSAEEPAPIGIGPSAEYGLVRLTAPFSPVKHLSISGHGGYGVTESMGPVSGGHHRLLGTFSVAGSPLEMLSLKLSFLGYHDRHPDDAEGSDSTTVGVPRLGVRAGGRIGELVQIGGALDIIVPGDDAPSFALDATTLEPKLLVALSKAENRWRLLFNVGYRWDNSGKTAPDAASLRPGDRISIGTSEFDAVLLGLGASYSFVKTEIIAEVTSDLFVGSGAPTGSSPVRLGVGLRHRVIPSLQLSFLTETLLSGRSALDATDPIMPVEPRFTVQLGATYTFDFGKRETPQETAPDIEASTDEPGPSEPASTVTTSLQGKVVDEEGNPIGGARVGVSITDEAGVVKNAETTTDSTGSYKLNELPVGQGTVRIQIDGFDPVEKTVQLTETPMSQEPDVLTQSVQESPTQLRGQIRSISGDPLKAKLIVKPGGNSIATDSDGYFSIDLPSGTYSVTINAPGHKTQKKRVVIEENSVTIINVDLRRAR